MIDLHVETFVWTRIFGYDLAAAHGPGPTRARYLGQADLPRLAAAGLSGVFLSIATNPLRRAGTRESFVVVGLALAATDRALRFLAGGAKLGAFFSYLWQYYLPKLSSQSPVPGLPRHAFYTRWVRGSWAEFGWSEIHFPDPGYKVLAVVSVACAPKAETPPAAKANNSARQPAKPMIQRPVPANRLIPSRGIWAG